MQDKLAKQSFYFIINPVSGKGKLVKKVIHILEKYLIDNKINYHFHYTEEKGHAKRIAKELGRRPNVHAIVVVGGDGTFHEVINGLYPTQIPVGYIPTGSGNDYAREMGISKKDPIKTLEKILKMEIKEIDIAKINDEFFINVTGIGLDGLVARLSNQSRLKAYLGKLIYVYSLIKGLFKFKAKEMDFTIDGKIHHFRKVWLVAIANGRYYGGGMAICPKADIRDGKLDICVVSNVSLIEILFIFPLVFLGKHIYHPSVKMYRGETVSIHLKESIDAQTDGETFVVKQVEGEILKKRLYII